MRARSLIAAAARAVLVMLSLGPSSAAAQVTLRERAYALAACSDVVDPVSGRPLVCGTATARSEQAVFNDRFGFTLVNGRATFSIARPFTWAVTGCGPVGLVPGVPDCDIGGIISCFDTICPAGQSS